VGPFTTTTTRLLAGVACRRPNCGAGEAQALQRTRYESMTITTSTRVAFRSDINGLRAWAVGAVMLYHFRVPGFSGGFVGVDVFFVISVFLMTGIVVSGFEHQGCAGFSILGFYAARARRILPALIVLSAALLTLGWWALLPRDYRGLADDDAYSLIFLSNVRFWRDAGYFETSSHERWLLHTWSLAVEWQFYLLLPVSLLAVWKWRPERRAIAVAIAVALLASFATSVVATPLYPTAAFYLLPARAWEMLAGGLVYLRPERWALTASQRKVLEITGLALVIGSVFGFDALSQWPGWCALVPVTGSVLILLAEQSTSTWTGPDLAQWLGTRSYSVYLWHWPIVVALAYLEWQAEPMAVCAGLLLALLLGHLSYRWVEDPARKSVGLLRGRRGVAALLCATVLTAASGALVSDSKGVEGRFSPEVERVAQAAYDRNPRQGACLAMGGVSSPSCIYGGGRLRAILIGDSHADAVATALAAAVPDARDGIMDWAYISCLTALGVRNMSPSFGPNERCGDFLDWAVSRLNDVPADIPLVIVNRTSAYALGHIGPSTNGNNAPLIYFTQPYAVASPDFLSEFAQRVKDTACKLAKSRPVYMVRPFPEMGVNVPNAMARAMALGRHKDISISLAAYHQRHDLVWAAQDAARDDCGVKILDPLPYLCRDGQCPGMKDGRPIYYDDHHLNESGNRLLIPMFAEVFLK
jgi:peptidoglycan/LPS O-acetylase OafA/YrhL